MTAATPATHITSAMSSKKLCVTKSISVLRSAERAATRHAAGSAAERSDEFSRPYYFVLGAEPNILYLAIVNDSGDRRKGRSYRLQANSRCYPAAALVAASPQAKNIFIAIPRRSRGWVTAFHVEPIACL